MSEKHVVLITGTRKGIGKALAHHFAGRGMLVVGCSRKPAEYQIEGYRHFCLDVADEKAVKQMFAEIRKTFGSLDILINNAGIALMNHFLLTPISSVERVLRTNVTATFLFCREATKIMQKAQWGRIVNMSTVAVPLRLEGEAIYAASKAAVESLTSILAREVGGLGITVNAIGPIPIETDLIRNVPKDKIDRILEQQAIKRLGSFADVINLIEFFIRPESELVTGQVVYLGGV